MKVYELIQELSKFDADTEVDFRFNAKFDTDVDAHFDRNDENDTQNVTVEASFHDDVEYDGIEDHEMGRGRKYIQVNLTY